MEALVDDNKGVRTAGLLLQSIEAALRLITRNKHFEIILPTRMAKTPHLKDRIERFMEYASNIKESSFHPYWWKHIGAIAVPYKGHNGNIHMYILDNGLLSKSIDPVPLLNYKHRSAFFINRVLGLQNDFRKIKGNIHLHVIDIADLGTDDLMGIKHIIAKEHESSGNYIPKTSMLPFSSRSLCEEGPTVKDAEFLSVNDPFWFQRQIPKWKMSG